MLDQILSKIAKDDRVNFSIAFVLAFIVHLFIFTNSFVNKDGLYFFYDEQNMSASGRFMLTYLAGISSFFSLQYFNGILSVLYIALTVTLLIKMFKLQSNVSKFAVTLCYIASPSIAGTFAYMYVADAYLLANLLAVISVYILQFSRYNIVRFVLACILIYVSLATYQANLGFLLTLIALLAITELFTKSAFYFRYYIKTVSSVVVGLILYFIHYKLYQLKYGVTTYQGLDQAGQLSLNLLIESSKLAVLKTGEFLLSPLNFSNLFEYLNLILIVTFIVVWFMHVKVKLLPLKRALLILLLVCCLPFLIHIVYFASPGVTYHVLMQQHIAIIFFMVIVSAEQLYIKATRVTQYLYTFVQLLVLLVGFNLAIITNIYYEKFDEVNTKVYSVMNQIALDIRQTDGYHREQDIIVIGLLNEHIHIGEQYDLSTPRNVGASSTIIYDGSTFVLYMDKIIGLKFNYKQNYDEFLSLHAQQIEHMPSWPTANSIQILDNTILLKLSEDE